MRIRTVLFTGGGGAGSSALFGLLPHDCHFADSDPCARPYGVPWSHWHQIPRADDPGFVDGLFNAAASCGATLIVPGVDEELPHLTAQRWSALVPPASFVTAHLDKLASYELLRDADIPVPLTVEGGMFPEIPLPWVVKPRTGRGSRGVMTVSGAWEAARCGALYDDHIVQEKLEGEEYTVTVAADADGKLRAIVPVLVGLKRGITIRARTTHDSAVTEACERIHAAYPVSGCYNVQGIKCADGVFRPFEINPRVSTTLCLAIAAGVDPIGIYLGDYPGEGLLPFRDVSLRRSWHNEFAEVA